ncbi:TonB-dependent siderophore receptor [Pseudozobellia sp. WGM2]|uniref:TonB-dependent receptor plug domain-containing protein n=1 Tax=Pseudozobellia sp. WGM2 TaxID=2787625 RepID=UPI001ADF0082|nr:TonB-dependent receptor [Pseudozobellia sp. WGM2]
MNKILLVIVLLLYQLTSAQETRILDADTGEPISNVAIFNSDKSKTAISDIHGLSNLSVFTSNERITFKHLSYQLRKSTRSQISRQGNRIFMVMKAEELAEVVMSVSKWEQQKKDIPNKIDVISAKEIAFNNPQTSADLLGNTGKVFVQKSQMGGGSPMIRGFATNRLLLSVDGVRMNNAIFRGGNLQNVISIDPYAINNTEIIFGPGSVIYGSDAIGGVMNFYTKKPEFSSTDSLSVSGKGNCRFSTANMENTIHADFNFGKRKWAFLTSATYNNFGDMVMGKHGPQSYLRNKYVETSNGQDILKENEKPRKQLPTGYNQINFMQKISYRPSNIWRYDLGLHYSETSDYSRYDRLIRPNSANDGLRSAEWYYGPQKWMLGNLQLRKQGKGIFYDGLKITTAYQHFEESRNDRGFGEDVLYTTKENVDAISTNIDFENKKIGDLRLYYGGEYIFNAISSFGSQYNMQTTESAASATRYPDGSIWQTVAGYVNAEYRAKPNFTLLSGLRYSHVWIDASFDKTYYPFPFDDADLNNGALTGSVGFSWFPKTDLQITLNGSTGFRAPNIDDVGKIFDSEPGAVVVPNPDLEPEYAYNAELGVYKNFDDKLTIKGATYYTYLVDALVRREFHFNGASEIDYKGELSQVLAIQNAAKAFVYGFEFGIEAFLSDHISVTSNLTFTEGVEEEEDGSDSPGRHVAPTFGDFHLKWKNQRLKADLFMNYNGSIPYDDLAASERSKDYIYAVDVDGNPYSPSWHTLNFRSQYAISPNFEASFSFENITNERYRPYSSGIAAPGTNFIFGLGYNF